MKSYTKDEWYHTIRVGRRKYYNSLPDIEKKIFIKHIWKSRTKKDYGSVKFWNDKFPGMIVG
jgi:hypothetical protein